MRRILFWCRQQILAATSSWPEPCRLLPGAAATHDKKCSPQNIEWHPWSHCVTWSTFDFGFGMRTCPCVCQRFLLLIGGLMVCSFACNDGNCKILTVVPFGWRRESSSIGCNQHAPVTVCWYIQAITVWTWTIVPVQYRIANVRSLCQPLPFAPLNRSAPV